MKLKKSIKRLIIILVIVIAVVVAVFTVSKLIPKEEEVKEVKVINTIGKYGYELKDNKSKKYKALFKDLAKILKEKEVDEKAYAGKITEMFIVDFYSLADKSSKTDIGGVDLVHPDILANFLVNAENTFYKFVESNIYNNRKQQLPEIDTVTVESVEQVPYTYQDKTDEAAYTVKVNWTYKGENFVDYQKSATLVFIHQDKKLYLVELK